MLGPAWQESRGPKGISESWMLRDGGQYDGYILQKSESTGLWHEISLSGTRGREGMSDDAAKAHAEWLHERSVGNRQSDKEGHWYTR
jgi:hypothetical protein